MISDSPAGESARTGRRKVGIQPTPPASTESAPKKEREKLPRAAHPLLFRLGQGIRRHRLALGWTIQELAERSGLSQRFVVDIENGHGNPSVLSLDLLAQALRQPLSELMAEAERPDRNSIVALLGLRGAGKSTIGPRLAERLNLPFFELDALIEERAGLALASIFELHGESYYRTLEYETLQHFLKSHAGAVLATSGGIVTNPEAFRLLERACRLVWLKASPEEHLLRVQLQGDERPMRNRPHAMAELRTLLRAREPLYARAELTAETGRLGEDGTLQWLETNLRRA